MTPKHEMHDCCKQKSDEIEVHGIADKSANDKEANRFWKLKIQRSRHHHRHHDDIEN